MRKDVKDGYKLKRIAVNPTFTRSALLKPYYDFFECGRQNILFFLVCVKKREN